jgi:hypothetical protein
LARDRLAAIVDALDDLVALLEPRGIWAPFGDGIGIRERAG